MSKTRDELATEILIALIANAKVHLTDSSKPAPQQGELQAKNAAAMYAIIRKGLEVQA